MWSARRQLGMPVLRDYAIAAFLNKCAYRIFFPHTLAFSTAISRFYVFLFEAISVVIRKWQRICKLNLKKLLHADGIKFIEFIEFEGDHRPMHTIGIISVRLSQKSRDRLRVHACRIASEHFEHLM